MIQLQNLVRGISIFFQSFFSASSKIFRDFKGSRIDILIGLAHQQPSSSIELFSMRLGLAFHQERIFNHALTVRPTYAIIPAVLCNGTISSKFQNLFQCLWIWNGTSSISIKMELKGTELDARRKSSSSFKSEK